MQISLRKIKDSKDYFVTKYDDLCAIQINKKANSIITVKLHNEDNIDSIMSIIELAAQNKTAIIVFDYSCYMQATSAYHTPYSTPILETYICSKQGRELIKLIRQEMKKFLYTEIESICMGIVGFGQFNWGGVIDI